jgi:hypothetical protein
MKFSLVSEAFLFFCSTGQGHATYATHFVQI